MCYQVWGTESGRGPRFDGIVAFESTPGAYRDAML